MPYTYTKLQRHISLLKDQTDKSNYNFVKYTNIGQSNAGLDIDLLKISNKDKKKNCRKPTIVVMGRQHSGETHSSFIIHGLINYLLSKDHLAYKLRETFEFWIIPMINPDGVIVGNYRCNTQGKDMNRCFFADNDPEAKIRLTEVELFRAYIEENFSKKDPEKLANLKMFLDIHAHSAQRDIFTYAPHIA